MTPLIFHAGSLLGYLPPTVDFGFSGFVMVHEVMDRQTDRRTMAYTALYVVCASCFTIVLLSKDQPTTPYLPTHKFLFWVSQRVLSSDRQRQRHLLWDISACSCADLVICNSFSLIISGTCITRWPRSDSSRRLCMSHRSAWTLPPVPLSWQSSCIFHFQFRFHCRLKPHTFSVIVWAVKLITCASVVGKLMVWLTGGCDSLAGALSTGCWSDVHRRLISSVPFSPYGNSLRPLNGSQPNLDTYSLMTAIWKMWSELPGHLPPTGWGKKTFLGPTYLFNGTCYQQLERHLSIYRDSPTCLHIWWTLVRNRLRTVGEFFPSPKF